MELRCGARDPTPLRVDWDGELLFSELRAFGFVSQNKLPNWLYHATGAPALRFLPKNMTCMFILTAHATCPANYNNTKKQTPWPESTSDLYRPSDRRLSANLVPTFADRGVSRSQGSGSPTAVISVSRPELVLFLQVAPQAWVDPVPDPLLLRKSGSVGNRTRTSRFVDRNSWQLEVRTNLQSWV
jgi:hypothetical protein